MAVRVLFILLAVSASLSACSPQFLAGQSLKKTTATSSTSTSSSSSSSATPLSLITPYAMGPEQMCFINASSNLVCWGDPFATTGAYAPPAIMQPTTQAAGFSGFVKVSISWSPGCGITTSGTAKCWGWNDQGQLGNGAIVNAFFTPQDVVGLTGLVDIAAGLNFACAVKSGGSVYCWGRNNFGQIGVNDGVTPRFSSPQQVVTGAQGDPSGYLTGVTSVVANDSHACALTSGGLVYCWGANSDGRVGDGTFTTPRTAPRAVAGGLNNVTQIVAGGNHSCALKSDGTVWCWGYGGNRQLGNLAVANQNSPVQVVDNGGIPISGITRLSENGTDNAHQCAIDGTGALYCWGSCGGNWYYMLGDGVASDRAYAVRVSGIAGVGTFDNVSWVGTGMFHACAYSTTAGWACWGSNYSAQLGQGDTDDTPANHRWPMSLLNQAILTF